MNSKISYNNSNYSSSNNKIKYSKVFQVPLKVKAKTILFSIKIKTIQIMNNNNNL